MGEVSSRNFGLLIAYVLPGFLALWGLRGTSETARTWLTFGAGDNPTVGGFLYATLASLTAGMTLSAIRWALLDTLHHRTGLQRASWDDSQLEGKLKAFERLVEDHFRYYQFYAHSLLALLLCAAARGGVLRVLPGHLAWSLLAIAALSAVFFAASRDALRRYYVRVELLLGSNTSTTMTNGSHKKKTPEQGKKTGEKKPIS